MINEENINKLYDNVINNIELETKQLNNLGFNSKDIANLIEKGTIERKKRGYYKFININELIYYGKNLLAKDSEKSYKCFHKCYQLDPTNYSACFQLFMNSIRKKDYDEAFKYFDIIIQNENKYYEKDINLYLYLLNLLTKIPDKYVEYAKYIKLEDMLILKGDKRYDNINPYNEIRTLIFKGKLPYAYKKHNDIIKSNNCNTSCRFIQILLEQVLEKEIKVKKTIKELLENKKYTELYEYLDNIKNNNIIYEYIKKIVYDIININKTNKLPRININNTYNVYDAIDGKNYYLAYQLNIDYLKKYNMDYNDNLLYLALSNIYELIENNKLIENNNKNIQVSEIISSLLNQNINEATDLLKIYLKNIDKLEYEYLILKLIDINLKEDKKFDKVILMLIDIDKNNFNYQLHVYLQEFYINLSKNKIDIAKLYLDIINNSYRYGIDTNIGNFLLETFENTNRDTTINTKKADEDITIKNEINSIEKYQENKTIKDNILKQNKKDIEYIEEKYKILKENKDIIVLKPMREERINELLEILKDYHDIDKFVIENKLVLRYISNIKLDYKKTSTEASEAYRNKDYDKCINGYKLLLQIQSPKTYVYANLGLAYMKKLNLPLAISYLEVATYLGKKEINSYDFTDLIDILKGKISKDVTKPRFKMNEDEFNYNEFNINNIDEVLNIIKTSNLSVNDICNNLNLDLNDTNKLKLYLAVLYYKEREYIKGDIFYNSVLNSTNKSMEINKMLKDIQNNKKFYINRKDENDIKLPLTLKLK